MESREICAFHFLKRTWLNTSPSQLPASHCFLASEDARNFLPALSRVGGCSLRLLMQAYFEQEVCDLCFDLFARVSLFTWKKCKES